VLHASFCYIKPHVCVPDFRRIAWYSVTLTDCQVSWKLITSAFQDLYGWDSGYLRPTVADPRGGRGVMPPNADPSNKWYSEYRRQYRYSIPTHHL